MLRVIVGVNVVVSALVNHVSPPATVLRAVVERRLRLVASPELVGELDRVLHKPQLRRWFSLEDADRTCSTCGASGTCTTRRTRASSA
ncbi:MAG TPA: putative toxin-antitoxin system toxin component, PIN family [Frankiaceae bacterium]|nr:putative toxin-antitoxin system toxin component, PIN family [Frankiaceae bacterium]